MKLLNKRLIALLMVGGMSVTSLAGCGNSKSTTETQQSGLQSIGEEQSAETKDVVTVQFWNMFGGGEGDFVDEIVRNFNESQSEVLVETIRLESNEFYAKYGAALAAGKGPDVAVTHSDRLSSFVNGGQLAELDSLAATVGFDFKELSDLNTEAVTFTGKHYSVPIDTHFHMCYYNKEILAEAGKLKADGTPDFGELSPAGLTAFLSAVNQAVPDKVPFCINTPYFKEPFYNFYYEAAGNLLTADLTKADLNNVQAREVLDFYLNAYQMGLADLNDVNPWDTFASGDSAIWFGGVWEAGIFFNEENGDRFGAVALPAFFGSETHWASSHGLTIPEYVDPVKKEAAMKFIVYFATEGAQIWGKAGHVPASKAVTASPEYQALPYRDEFVKAQKTVKFAPKIDNYNAVDTAIQEHLQTIVFGDVSVDDGLKALEDEINSLIN